MGATDVAHYAHYDAFGRAIRSVGGKMEVCAIGSFAEGDRLPSEEILAICAEYADAADGLPY